MSEKAVATMFVEMFGGYEGQKMANDDSIPVVLSPGEYSLDGGKTWQAFEKMPGGHSKLAPSSAKRWNDCPGTLSKDGGRPKKHRDDKGCSGNCMPGLGGNCVACSEDDWT